MDVRRRRASQMASFFWSFTSFKRGEGDVGIEGEIVLAGNEAQHAGVLRFGTILNSITSR